MEPLWSIDYHDGESTLTLFSRKVLTLVLMDPYSSCFEKTVDPDQLASDGVN